MINIPNVNSKRNGCTLWSWGRAVDLCSYLREKQRRKLLGTFIRKSLVVLSFQSLVINLIFKYGAELVSD